MTHENEKEAFAHAQAHKRPANPVTVLLRGAVKRCPNCGHAHLFQSWINIKARCPRCQITLQPYAGDALGVYAVAYALTLVPALLALVLAFFFLKLSYVQLIALFGLISGSLLVTLFPNFKTLWIAMVYLVTGLRPRL